MAFEVKMPQLGLTMEEGTIGQWMKQEGDTVAVGDVLVSVETDKLTNDVESEFAGVLLKIVAQEGTDVPVQGIMAYIGEAGEVIETGEAQVEVSAQAEETPVVSVTKVEAAAPVNLPAGGRIRISPLAKKTATTLGVDYTMVAGTGPGGRIVQQDIFDAERKGVGAPVTQMLVQASGNLSLMDGDEVIKPSGMRKTIAERMVQSHTQIPTVTTVVKTDVTKLLELREKINEEAGKKYSVNDFILKAAAKALTENRQMLVSWNGDTIIRRGHINLGMAVALEEGLIVPVIHDADRLGLQALSETAKDLAIRAREGGLSPSEYQGSTFSISNMGMMDIETFNPIINQPDAAILGVCAISDELDLNEAGIPYKKKVMRLALTWDHRLLDGSDAAKFQKSMKNLLENPFLLLL